MENSNKYALITGITGQDGYYCSKLLLEKGYKVYGVLRRCSTFNTQCIDEFFDKLTLFHGDLTDISSLIIILNQIKEDLSDNDVLEVYNLGAQSANSNIEKYSKYYISLNLYVPSVGQHFL